MEVTSKSLLKGPHYPFHRVSKSQICLRTCF